MPFKDPEKRKAYRRAYEAARKSSPERKARQAELHRKRRRLDPVRFRKRDKIKHERDRKELALLAGRPKPDVCEVCARAPTKRGLMFDHCHQKGHFRGWLCNGCNVALGSVNDDVQILRKLIAYLERNRENTSPQLALAGI